MMVKSLGTRIMDLKASPVEQFPQVRQMQKMSLLLILITMAILMFYLLRGMMTRS